MIPRPPRRISLANLPTRIHPLSRLSAALGGPEIWVKRDDETGSDLTGNKVRKLEFLLAEAEDQQADLIITCGGVQSNHCRATAIAARRLGMDSLLFLRGEDPGTRDGNLLLDALVGADLRFITPEQYAARAVLMAAAAGELRAAGRRPYVIPEGGSNALGSYGYVILFEELASQSAGGRPEWDHIVCATGSGGTLAGLALGAKLAGRGAEGSSIPARAQVHGVNVCDSALYFRARAVEIAEEFRKRFLPESAASPLAADEVSVIEGYKGPAYAVPYPEELALIREVGRTEGLLLDPVYTGKAFHGLVEEIKRGRFARGERVLFIHTGGAFSLFPYRRDLVG